MFNPRQIHRSAIACGIVLTLAVPGTALAMPSQDLRSPDARDAAAVLQTRQDLRSPDARDAAQAGMRTSVARALAQERYYSSYGKPEPVAAAQPAATPDDSHRLTLVLSITAALAVVALSVVSLRRLRIRRRRAVVTP